MTAIGEWGSSTVAATFLNQDGTMASGTWTASVPVDLRSATGTKRIILAGVVASGNFTTTPGGTSLSFSCPSNADPDLMPTTPAWQPIITVITGGATRVYVFDVPVGGTLDLHDYVPTTSAGVTSASQSIALGVPGGVPLLNAGMTGLVDANGTPLSIGAAADWTTLANKPAVIAAGATQAAARSAIGAGTSSLALGTTGSTAKAGDYQPAAANITDSTATGRAILTAASAAAARTAIGAGTSDLALGSTETTAAAGDHGHIIAGVNGLQAALDAKAATSSIGTLWRYRSTADWVVNNQTTITAVTGFSMPIAAGEEWDFSIILYLQGDAAADAKVVVDAPSGATGHYVMEGSNTGAAGPTGTSKIEAYDAFGTVGQAIGTFGGTSTSVCKIEGTIVNGATAGNVTIKAAQSVATAVDTKVLAGSVMAASKVVA